MVIFLYISRDTVSSETVTQARFQRIVHHTTGEINLGWSLTNATDSLLYEGRGFHKKVLPNCTNGPHRFSPKYLSRPATVLSRISTKKKYG